MDNKPKILFLARWYPNRYDSMFGLFIQRHAEAVQKYCQVGVVYTRVVEHENLKGFDVDFKTVNGVPTACVYYSNPKAGLPLILPMIKAARFFKANFKGIKKVNAELGGFDLVHVHILTRLGLIALWYKWFKGKPFVISEHWSRYLSLTGDFNGGFRKWLTKLVVKNASAVTTVTQNLANAMQSHQLDNSSYKVLANIVTDQFLNYQRLDKTETGKTTFIHVSCFEDKSKNISGLLNVIKSLSDKRNDFVFKLIGEGMDFDFLKQYAANLNLDESQVKFTGLLEGEALVKEMAAARLMVVFSYYENFPVVINESFVLGIPVIATSVGGIPEYINDSNGRLIEAADEIALEKHLVDFLDGNLEFDINKVQSEAKNTFSPERVGKELYALYNGILNPMGSQKTEK